MEPLGAMEPQQLLQLLMGVLGCAVAMFVLTLVYVALARRSSRARARSDNRSATGLPHDHVAKSAVSAPAVQAPPAGLDPRTRPAALDIEARLAGTGRDVRQSQPAGTPLVLPSSGGKEIMRVVQDPATGKIRIRAAGVPYSRLSDVRDRHAGETILAAITYALRFSNGMAATDAGVTIVQLPTCDAVAVPEPMGLSSDSEEPGEVIRLSADAGRRQFWVQASRRRYRTLSDVADSAARQRILEAITYLLQFSRGRLCANDGVRVVPIPALSFKPGAPGGQAAAPAGDSRRTFPGSIGDDIPGSVASVASVASPEQEEAFLRELMKQSPAPPDARTQRPKPGGSGRGSGKTPAAAPPSFSLAEEIDRIFQRQLGSSPLAHVDAQIAAHPDGSVRIRVGAKFYDRPDEVPDAELRKIIEASIAEW